MNKHLYKLYEAFRYKRISHLEKPDSFFEFLKESQYWEREKLEEFQLESLNDLLLKAQKAPIYKNLHSGLNLQLNNLDELNNFPIVTKSYYQDNMDDFATDDYKRIGWLGRSSGSTGKPTIIYLSQIAMAYRNASKLRFFSWWGISQYDRWVNFTAYPKKKNSFKSRLIYNLTPRIDVDIFTISQENIYNICNSILKFKPIYFRGYVSAIVSFAKFVEENNIDLSKLNLKTIIVTSEILYDVDREYIERVFNCKVANEYGAAEGGLYAYQCQEGGMHLQEESILMNINEENELISTEFANSLMPLINYKVGDRINISGQMCACGRKLRTIDSIEGRIGSDDIITPDGRVLNYLFFDRMIKNLGNTPLWGQIKRFQIIQNGMDFNCNIVKMDNYNDEIENYIINFIKNGLGKDVNVNIIYKDDIPLEKSGKFRIFKRIVD